MLFRCVWNAWEYFNFNVKAYKSWDCFSKLTLFVAFFYFLAIVGLIRASINDNIKQEIMKEVEQPTFL